jgi:hypothetical protein
MSALSLAATQIVRIWELRASIERAAHLLPEAAADNNSLFRFEPHDSQRGLAC